MEMLLEIRNIVKTFGIVKALNGVDIEVRQGDILGLIGENGSGKSTVSSIMTGAQKADSGTMKFKGEPYAPSSALDAAHSGICMIVQESGTIPGLTVAQNIYCGKEELFRNGIIMDRKKMNQDAARVLEEIGIDFIKPDDYIDGLNFENRKLVEIARAVQEKPEILIVDETTTALSNTGRDILYEIIKKQAQDNKAVVFISHDLDELMRVCNVLTVLRDGDIVRTLQKEEMEPNLIRNLMIGRELSEHYYREDEVPSRHDKVALRVTDISSANMLEHFSMKLFHGEILGIGGLSGSGMHEVGAIIYGLEKPITGQVVLESKGLVLDGEKAAIDNGIGYVSKDRDKEALILNDSIKNNLVLPALDKLGPWIFVDRKREGELAKRRKEMLDVKCYSVDQDVSTLSGGNKQKVSFGKWLDSDILVLDCPTRGIDVGVKATMYRLMEDWKEQGKAIIMISEEMSELIGMCDRVMVIKDGICTAELQRGVDLNETEMIRHLI